ncbi:hypothetical protein F4782DRAFT_392109 [Xylaria castorea]|nr:hypothetical protein F4782DRAFT_392109 [Xylaria castorea]
MLLFVAHSVHGGLCPLIVSVFQSYLLLPTVPPSCCSCWCSALPLPPRLHWHYCTVLNLLPTILLVLLRTLSTLPLSAFALHRSCLHFSLFLNAVGPLVYLLVVPPRVALILTCSALVRPKVFCITK